MKPTPRIAVSLETQTHDHMIKVQQAQRCVAAAMVSCLGLWFAPIVSGVACTFAESVMIKKVMRIMGCHSKEGAEQVFWFFREKTFFLFGATYIPVAGVPLQLFETYGLGQFAIHCALQPDMLTDNAWLEESWRVVAPEVFSGHHSVQFYEQFTGSGFPEFAREKFLQTVDGLNKLYLLSQMVPGVAKVQEKLGRGTHKAVQAGEWTVKAAIEGTRLGLGPIVGIGLALFGRFGPNNRTSPDFQRGRDANSAADVPEVAHLAPVVGPTALKRLSVGATPESQTSLDNKNDAKDRARQRAKTAIEDVYRKK